MTQQRNTCSYLFTLLISSIMLCFGSVNVTAQEKETVQKVIESINTDTTTFFRGVSVSVDLFGAVQRQVSDYGQYEAALRINLLDKYFPVIELGIGDAKHDEDPVSGISTDTRAPYYRIGCDFNIMKNKHDDYRIYLGARYAYTSYKFNVQHADIIDPVWGTTAHYGIDDADCYCHWLEGAFTIDAKIAGPVRMGWSVRYRRSLFSDEGPGGNTWYTPGYGRTGKTCIGGTFNLTFEL